MRRFVRIALIAGLLPLIAATGGQTGYEAVGRGWAARMQDGGLILSRPGAPELRIATARYQRAIGNNGRESLVWWGEVEGRHLLVEFDNELGKGCWWKGRRWPYRAEVQIRLGEARPTTLAGCGKPLP